MYVNLLFYLFFHRRPIQQLYVSFCRPFVVNTTFEQVLWVKFLLLTPTRPVENVVLRTKGQQESNIQLLDGMTVEK